MSSDSELIEVPYNNSTEMSIAMEFREFDVAVMTIVWVLFFLLFVLLLMWMPITWTRIGTVMVYAVFYYAICYANMFYSKTGQCEVF
jgi:hypothetical protein